LASAGNPKSFSMNIPIKAVDVPLFDDGQGGLRVVN